MSKHLMGNFKKEMEKLQNSMHKSYFIKYEDVIDPGNDSKSN